MVKAVKGSGRVEQSSKTQSAKKQHKPIDKRVNAVAIPCFDEIRTVAGATRLGLKAARAYNPSLGPQVTPAIGVLGFCSLYTVVQTPANTYQALQGVHENLTHGDAEGVIFDSIGSVQAVAGGVDGLTVSLISLGELISKAVVPKLLEKIFLPLAIASTAVEVFTRAVKIYQTNALINQIKLSKSGGRFRANPLTKRHFIRLTSKEIYKVMKSGKRGMRVAGDFLQRKIRLEKSNQALEITTLALLVLFTTSFAPHLIFGSLTLVTLFKVALMVYEKKYLYVGLTAPSKITKIKTEFDN